MVLPCVTNTSVKMTFVSMVLAYKGLGGPYSAPAVMYNTLMQQWHVELLSKNSNFAII